jgi:ribosome biogenesis GTPase A
VLDLEELSRELLGFLIEKYPKNLKARYNIECEMRNAKCEIEDIFQMIAKTRGSFDDKKTAGIIISDFRKERLGKIILE